MINEFPRKVDLTLDELVHTAQDGWYRFRDAQLYAFVNAAPLLSWARRNEVEFLTYCRRNSIAGDMHETRVVELMLAIDLDDENGEGEPIISRERRAEFAACIGWFADRELCPETDADKAVAVARQKSRITGIAREYRAKKDADAPVAKAAKRKAQATKARKKSSAASAAKARDIIDGRVSAESRVSTKPDIIQRRPTCEANGDAAAMIEFFDSQGVQPRIRRDLDDDGEDEIYIYLRVLNRHGKFIWYGAAVHFDLADQIADLIVAEAGTRSATVAEAA